MNDRYDRIVEKMFVVGDEVMLLLQEESGN